jgi:hypothetical protein
MHWPRKFGAPITKLVSSCSLLLLFVAVVCAIDYRQLDAQLQERAQPAQVAELLGSVANQVDDELHAAIDEAGANPTSQQVDDLRWLVAKRAMAEVNEAPSGDATRQAQTIKSSPLFRDPGEKDSANWLGSALERLSNLFQRKKDDTESRPVRLPSMGGGSIGWVTPLIWVLLGGAIAAFLYFALRNVNFAKLASRKRKAVLEEDEPDRTLDEWLAQADDLAKQGRYREAIRALYLSCLLKFDQHRVARFVRADTNWEHLARIRKSEKLPPGLDFLPATQAFDRVWYGHRDEGYADFERFRGWYEEIQRALEAIR